MTDRLSLYNGALRLLGQRKLASLSENREPRRALDEAWADGAVKFCLEAGQWKFAMRAVRLDAAPSVAPGFGYAYAFDIPADHCRLGGVFSDEAMTQPFRDYREEGEYWVGSMATMFIRYVSKADEYGMNFSRWPARFVKFVEAHLACEVALIVTNDEGRRNDMLKLRDKVFLPDALSNDAMQEATKSLPIGGWVRARYGSRSGREQA